MKRSSYRVLSSLLALVACDVPLDVGHNNPLGDEDGASSTGIDHHGTEESGEAPGTTTGGDESTGRDGDSIVCDYSEHPLVDEPCATCVCEDLNTGFGSLPPPDGTCVYLACGDETSLDGRRYVSESAEGFSIIPSSPLTMHFDVQVRDDLEFHTVSASGGCNGIYSDSYTLEDGVIKIDGESTTLIGCLPDLHQQDSLIGDFLWGEPTVEIVEPRLILTRGDTRLVMLDRTIADLRPDLPLTGTRWRMFRMVDKSEFEDNYMVLSVLTTDGAPSITFGDDGEASIFTGCTTGLAEVTTMGSELILSEVVYGDELCPETIDPTIAQAHESILQEFQSGFSFRSEISFDVLEMSRGVFVFEFQGETE